MKLVSITKSNNKYKKLMAKFLLDNGKVLITHFGAVGFEDFTIHKDEKRKELYINRHKSNENWNDPTTAGSLSRYILWNKPTIDASIKDFRKKFNI